MKALLYIRLLSEGETIAYGNPILEQVKKIYPDVAVLDVDSKSGELVLHYGRQLLLDADQTTVCIDSSSPDAEFGSIFPLLELILESEKKQHILFRKNHNRLQRMVQARPDLNAIVLESDAEFLRAVEQFYSPTF